MGNWSSICQVRIYMKLKNFRSFFHGMRKITLSRQADYPSICRRGFCSVRFLAEEIQSPYTTDGESNLSKPDWPTYSLAALASFKNCLFLPDPLLFAQNKANILDHWGDWKVTSTTSWDIIGWTRLSHAVWDQLLLSPLRSVCAVLRLDETDASLPCL